MSYSFTSASSHVMTRTASTPASGYPFYVSAWVKATDTAAEKHIFSSYNNANTADRWDLRAGSAEDARAVQRTATGPAENAAVSSASGFGAAWTLYTGEYTANNARRAGANAANYGTTSTSITHSSTPNRVRLGLSGAGTSGMDGLLGLVFVHSSLNDTERTELLTYHPLYATSRPNLVALWDLTTDQGTTTIVDPIGGYDLSISGATFNSDNPTLISTIWPQLHFRTNSLICM